MTPRAFFRLGRGFTMIEVLLVIGIIGAVTSVSIPMYRDYQVRSDLNIATEQATQGLSRARILAQSGKDDTQWGFYVPNGTLYKGSSYATRVQAYDEVYPMPSTITTTGLLEVSYSRVEGAPSSTGTVLLTALTGDQRSIVISIDKSGIAMNTTDTVTVCHVTGEGGEQHTLHISDNAWPAHQGHGDSLGSCPGETSSSAASSTASSVASSVASSAASSASSSVAASCADRFSIAADGTVTTTSTVNITFNVLGSAITYGEGGPEINVYAAYKKTTGSSYNDLFSGNDIDGGETQTVSNIAANKEIRTRLNGYYRNRGWLTFDRTYYNQDQTGHILTLRDGDLLPSYPAFDNQDDLEAFLQPYIDEDGRVQIGQYEILYLVEFGDLGNPMPISADFQDAVLLLTFNQPVGACS
jgi:prepilin-type N-terminal cleavage/methylation domain-containing protein